MAKFEALGIRGPEFKSPALSPLLKSHPSLLEKRLQGEKKRQH